MNYLTYASSEMFSSTELIRKSKMVFDKLSNKQIEKAVILRDGKPSFMLLDFQKYEELMNEYLRLKSLESQEVNNVKISVQKEVLNTQPTQESSIDEINEDDLEEVLAKIEELDIQEDTNKPSQPLKEFWD